VYSFVVADQSDNVGIGGRGPKPVPHWLREAQIYCTRLENEFSSTPSAKIASKAPKATDPLPLPSNFFRALPEGLSMTASIAVAPWQDRRRRAPKSPPPWRSKGGRHW
jgi:hypothetical protein